MAVESVETSFRLQDRTAVLAGPCNSTNQAIAIKLTQMGVNVALIDRNADKIKRFADQLMDAREVQEKYGRATAISADLLKAHHVQDAVSRASETFGGIDIYVDGMLALDPKPFKNDKSLDEIERVIDVNLRSPLLLTHAVLRFLQARKRGRVIFLLPDLARMGMAGTALMSATRTGLMSFAKALARETAESNVTVNCVAMGVTEEFLLAQNGTDTVSIQELQSRLLKHFPQATMTEPDKIASLVAFLASPLGAGVTGQTIAVSQGLSYLS